ncbi:arabinosyltransferase domain-containing protein [Pseudonocardia hydrocarbonoxydans]|uniref:Arabinosyltransferase n=1 Tax=Pseudonocardia hydrocarbonoxydans TaxID=76726 RepID=A0A4Y3WWG1_9PSEU|nr:arabinosyltransferase domain-containing protein [Pseudonocardia hydrocarbonoxydans]GEC22069.1 arabinosyltransferase [Pseudonocardia hydrocarbonoxydans]
MTRLVIALALLTGLLGIGAVLAPVDADDPVLTWPRAGEAPVSTVVPLSPYRPLELRADVPCGQGEILRTLPADVDATLGSGLVVASADGRVTIDSSGQRLLDAPVAAGCAYTVEADAAGTRVLRDGAVVADRPGLLPPQVAVLETSATGDGLAVEIHTDARYQSSPTPLKTALLVAHGLALLALLVVAWRAWPGRGPGLRRPSPSPADAVVLVVSAAWAVLGPVNIDDSWYALMARAAGASGYVGNYIYQFNVTENPFVLSQYAMQAWGQLGGWNLLWLRMLPLAYGLATYVLLRVLLATVLPRVRAVPWALAGAHLLWFCAYGITLRPETAIVVLSAAVLLLVELARRRESIGALAAATALAALAMTVSPTALVAVAPLVVALPWLWRWLRGASVVERTAAGLLALASASVVVPVGFADATLGDVLESVSVHRWYYRQHPWYDEFVHYAALLGQTDQGAWGKRLPVLFTLAVLVLGLLAVGRTRGAGGPSARLLASSSLVTVLALASMALTPTKWVNHFGAVAAPATVLLAVALLRTPIPRRAGTGPTAIAALAAVGAAAVSFAGPNLWRPFADWGQPFGNHADLSTPVAISATTPGIGPLELRNPLLWLAVAGVALYVARRGLTPDRAVLGVAVAGGVALLLAAFTLAPLRQAPGASVASTNLAGGCGFADAVTVLDDTGVTLGAPSGTADLTGDAVAGTPPERAAVDGGSWHTDVADGTGTGSVATPWYPVPAGGPDDAVVVASTGDLRAGQEIALEFRLDGDVTPVVLDPAGLQPDWVDRTVALGELPARPAEVRAVARDTLAGDDTWLGVSAPRLAVSRPAAELTAGAPVFADQVSAVFWPCADQIEVRDGLAEPPAYRLRAGDGLEEAIEDNAFFAPNGGTLVGIDRTARFVELPSELPGGVATLGWGHVDRVVYDHPTGRFDLTVGTERRNGWTRLPTLVGEAYTGRGFIG